MIVTTIPGGTRFVYRNRTLQPETARHLGTEAPMSAVDCPYERLRYLVIEDSNTMRTWLRTALGEMGGKKIDVAVSYADALTRIRNRDSFDVVLCDYMLSDTRDGQQLLEEVRRTRLLPSASIWLMITGENSYEQVFSAAELAPDDYLLKPVSPKILKDRLDRAWARKQAIKEAAEQLDQGTYRACVDTARAALKTNTPYVSDFLRLVGEGLLGMGHFKEAYTHYESVQTQYPKLPWARLGAARAYFMLERHDEAQELLEQLAQDAPDFLRAQDLLAKVHEKKGDLDSAKRILNQLIDKNPKALHRHREIVRAAAATGDHDMALKAYELMHSHGKGSSFVKPSDYCSYAGMLMAQGVPGAAEKLSELTKQMADYHHGQDEFGFAMTALRFAKASVADDPKSALQAYQAMQAAMGDASELDNEQRMAMLQAAVSMQDEAEAMRLAKVLYADFQGNDQMLGRVDGLLSGEIGSKAKSLKAEAQREIENLNRHAINIAKSGQLREAVEAFISLTEQHPVLAIVLNAAVAIIKWMEDHEHDPYLANKLEQYIQFIRKRDPDNPKLAKIVETQQLLTRRAPG